MAGIGEPLERRTITVDGAERVYWLAQPAHPGASLLVVLHGSGINGPRMAAWTGLARRGPQAGFTTVFPDAAREPQGNHDLPARMWDDAGTGRRDGLDDVAFVRSVVDELIADEAGRSGAVILAGLSNGAHFAERLARHGLMQTAGIALVAGTAREASRQARPHPAQETAVLCVAGTADRVARYEGGRATGLMGSLARRRARSVLIDSGGREAVAVDTLARDWAAANGCGLDPSVDEIRNGRGERAGDRMIWASPGRRPVVVHRLVGAGHGWPGGPQYAPRILIGRIPSHVDATAIVLEFARDVVGLRLPGDGRQGSGVVGELE